MTKRAKGHLAATAKGVDRTRGRRLRLDTIVPADQLRGAANMRFPGCYANGLGRCSNKGSLEHFMSHGVLQGMMNDPRGVFVSGFSWARAGRWVRPETLAAPILCTAHNTALSGLDAFGQEFAEAFARIHAALQRGSSIATVVAFNGNNLERWLLKVLCGLLASGNGRNTLGQPVPARVRDEWLAVEYGLSDFIGSAGLYVHGERMTVMPTNPGLFSAGPLFADDGRAVGLQAMLPLFHGILVVDNFGGKPQGELNENSIRRPSALVWTDGKVDHRVELTWNHGGGGRVTMMYERDATSPTAA